MQCLEQSGKQYSFVYNRFAASDFTQKFADIHRFGIIFIFFVWRIVVHLCHILWIILVVPTPMIPTDAISIRPFYQVYLTNSFTYHMLTVVLSLLSSYIKNRVSTPKNKNGYFANNRNVFGAICHFSEYNSATFMILFLYLPITGTCLMHFRHF